MDFLASAKNPCFTGLGDPSVWS
ncbi:hypothetical protein POX_h09383 [Penicillium oxalicum]|nr:hypothetical protein POX_h09383 [Penicillium oxalicum]KAI2785627.1 hypothetical protein POX_h09383 [Penicillium oxalicum]